MGIYEEIASNQRKSYLLVFFFLVFIVFIGLLLGIYWSNRYFGLILAIIVGVIYFLFSYYCG